MNPYQTRTSQVMEAMAADILNHNDRHRELADLARALREALNNPGGPLAQLAIQAYDDWTNQ